MASQAESVQLDFATPKPWRRWIPSWLRSLIWVDFADRYDAFLSYSWKADSKTAPVIHSVLQRFLCPWYKLRAKTIFRDLSCMPAGSSLKSELFDRMDRATHLIVLASPEAARSGGMEMEANHWFSRPRDGQVLIVVTAGQFTSWGDIRDRALPCSAVKVRVTLVGLGMGDLQLREEHWVIADLIGKGKHIRTVPVPAWTKRALDEWTDAAKISTGALFRRVSRAGKIWGDGLTPKAVWHIVKTAAKRAGIENLAPHDLRRICARLCHLAGGELEQIQFLLGHASVETTEHYLGCKQKLRHAVNDTLGLEDL